jgi:type III pantothenate kinase
MLGAVNQWPRQSLLVVDAGTALTLDWVDESGQHLGGWIIPGFRLQQQAVIGQTAKVFNNSMQHAQVALGTDTSSCLQNGCLSAAVAVILQGMQQQKVTKLVLTGGDAMLLLPHLSELNPQVEPLLIFRGLSLYI